jgi:PAS domain S-box-containing protein
VIGSQIGQFVQRRRNEEELRKSEERFRSLTTLSSDWYWEQDAEHRFVEMSNEIDRRTGVSAHSHIGKRRWELAAPNMTERTGLPTGRRWKRNSHSRISSCAASPRTALRTG